MTEAHKVLVDDLDGMQLLMLSRRSLALSQDYSGDAAVPDVSQDAEVGESKSGSWRLILGGILTVTKSRGSVILAGHRIGRRGCASFSGELIRQCQCLISMFQASCRSDLAGKSVVRSSDMKCECVSKLVGKVSGSDTGSDDSGRTLQWLVGHLKEHR